MHREPHVAGPGPAWRLVVAERPDSGAAVEQAERAARAAAQANADAANSERYRGVTGVTRVTTAPAPPVVARVAFCNPAPIAQVHRSRAKSDGLPAAFASPAPQIIAVPVCPHALSLVTSRS